MPSREWVEVKLSNLSDRLARLRPIESINFGKNTPTLIRDHNQKKRGSMMSSSLVKQLGNPWQLKPKTTFREVKVENVSNKANMIDLE